MVEKGLLQSQMVRENPLLSTMSIQVIGKRGRPPNALKKKREMELSKI